MTATQAPTPGPLTALEAIAKDAAERVQKNGDCVPQLSFAPILFALQDAASSQTNELKPNDIAAILEENADADADGLHNTSQLAETIYRRFEVFRLAPTAPVEASGSEECSDLYRFDDPFNGSVTRLASWPEGLVLWHGGEIVWRSWGPKALRPPTERRDAGGGAVGAGGC